ncbi:hypothetical protein [Streptomyces sp. NPDC050416]
MIVPAGGDQLLDESVRLLLSAQLGDQVLVPVVPGRLDHRPYDHPGGGGP